MNPLQLRLASLRRRLHMVTLWRGVCGILALLVGAALVVGVFDFYVHLPSLIRALCLVGVVGSAGYVFLRWLCLPLAKRSDDLTLALRVEEVYPELNDCLASTVQFLEEPEGEVRSSPALRKQAVEHAMKQADDCDFNRILDFRGVWLLGLAALVAGVCGWYACWAHGHLAQTALLRLAAPFGGHTWTQLTIANVPERIAQGQAFVLKGELAGIVPAQARLEIDGRLDKVIAVKKDTSQETGALVAPFDMTQQKGNSKFRFRILAGDAVFPRPGAWQEVQVLPPPRLVALQPQLELRFPAYTDLESPRKLSPGQGSVDAVVGTHVTLPAAVDRPLAKAWLELEPASKMLKPLVLLSPLGHSRAFEMLGLAWLGQSVTGKVPCQLEGDRTRLSVRFVPWLSGQYVLRFQDADGLANEYRNELRIFPDPPPMITVYRPSGPQSLLPNAQLTFKMRIEDEIFAVRSVYVEYRRKNTDGTWLDESPRRLPILDHDMMSREVPLLLASLAQGPRYLPSLVTRHSPLATVLRLRPRQLELSTRWPLGGQFKEGQTVVLQVCADDFNDLFEPRAVGRSHDIELRIVGKSELAKQIDEDFAKIQQELVRLQHMQEGALKAVEEVQKNRDQGKNNHDKLVEAEQTQRQIQERIGQRKDEGLRQELANLQRKMRDNQLPASDLQDRTRTLTTELDRLVREDLQQIETRLSDARKEMAGVSKPAAKNKDALAEARAHQQDAKKTLDELAKFLDPWANMHQIKGRTRDLLAKQKDLKKETDELMPMKPEALDKSELGKKGDNQNNLAQEAEDLLRMMNEVKNKKDNDGGNTSEKVEKALKVAEKGGLTQKMRDARDSLRDPKKLNIASQEQQDAVDNLKKMLAALEDERRDEEIDKLRKKQKKAEEKLEQIAEEMDRLQKKVKKAAALPDAQQRAEELKKLAKEQEKLKEEAQEEARELAKLRAERASREMARAAQEMDRAARKLEAGEDPEEMQQEALQRLQEAEARLEEAEEELAREQLARIADRIKGLKERQDAAVAESERIHKEMTRKGEWSNELLRSLNNSSTSQKGLMDETESVKEKLKDAKVFEHILDRAATSMSQAAETIKVRAKNKAAKERLDKEELTAENQAQEKVLKLQKDASSRLQRLLDALKNDPALAQNERKQEDGGEQQPMGGDGGMNLRGADGIPPIAQLKALRDEQTDIQQRTKDFAERHPDANKLNEEQRTELDQLRQEQARVHELFNQIMNKGEQP